MISFTNVTKKYGFTTALNNMSFDIPQGGIVGIVGANGSGKSTLLRLMAGLLTKTKGEIVVCGERVNRMISSKVAFLSDADSLYPFYTVNETVEFAKHVFPDFNITKAKEIVSALDLQGDKKVKALSKGQRARLKIAVALSRNVPIVIMDEPLSGLDPIVREDLLKMIATYAELEKQTMLISTHEVTEIEPLLDHVMLIKQGEIILSESVEYLREEKGKSVLDVMKEVLVK
ncbi:MAG: ABC transporter ATP-binding protein [Bacillaceae bacterium]|nr:ABC transporter ATP-binding protein [Bacillaceae bacterium]